MVETFRSNDKIMMNFFDNGIYMYTQSNDITAMKFEANQPEISI